MKTRLSRWWNEVERDASPKAMLDFLCTRIRSYSLGTAAGVAVAILGRYLENPR